VSYPSPKPKKRRESLRYEIVEGAFRRYPDGREVCLGNKKGQEEYRRRTIVMAERQKWICALPSCSLPMAQSFTDFRRATFEHQDGRGFGGSRRDDRVVDQGGRPMNVAMHYFCNSAKGSRRHL